MSDTTRPRPRILPPMGLLLSLLAQLPGIA